MTDKQIITDGVDVNECEYYDKNKPLLTCICEEYACSECHNCYYKQLKRKEQECEELKQRLQQCWNVEYSFVEQLDKLEAENEQLKEELSAIQHNCSREGCKYYDDNTFKVFYECKAQKALQLSANSVTTKYCDLLKTLTEIKEIAEKMKKMSEEDGGELTECFFTDKQCEKCSEDKCLPYWFEQILQKISEVENEN